MFKLIVVGPGLIGKRHIQLIQENSAAILDAIVAPDHKINHEIANRSGVPLYFSLQSCLKKHSPDGVIISSPNIFHSNQAELCILHNIPVLIEKPVTSSVAEGRKLSNLAQKHNAKALVGHHRAYSPLIETAKDVIKNGVLGQLVSVIGSAQFMKPKHYFLDAPWRTQVGGGPILINLIHEIGNLRALIGEVHAVQAISSSRMRKFLVEDTVAINLIFENGVLGTFLLSDTAASPKSWEQTAKENLAYPYYVDEDCYSISGTQGSLAIPSMRLKYYPCNVEPSWWMPFDEKIIPVQRLDPLKCQLEHFIDVIRGATTPRVSILDGFKNLLITEAIRQSAIEKNIVYIEKLI